MTDSAHTPANPPPVHLSIDRARLALRSNPDQDVTAGLDGNIVYLIADLLHYAWVSSFDVSKLHRLAYQHFCAEFKDMETTT